MNVVKLILIRCQEHAVAVRYSDKKRRADPEPAPESAMQRRLSVSNYLLFVLYHDRPGSVMRKKRVENISRFSGINIATKKDITRLIPIINLPVANCELE